MTVKSAEDFIEPHLNVYWLRPESALWDAIASSVISRIEFISPSVDVGAGNGIFSFITAGGAFSLAYDWYRNVDPAGFWQNKDIYDTFEQAPDSSSIVRKPDYTITCALDAKESLLKQAAGLGFYGGTRVADHVTYLSPLTLQAWDIGLRPLSPPLIKMVRLLSESDRAAIKTEWMEVCRPFLAELLTLDARSSGQGGYHFFCLEKI